MNRMELIELMRGSDELARGNVPLRCSWPKCRAVYIPCRQHESMCAAFSEFEGFANACVGPRVGGGMSWFAPWQVMACSPSSRLKTKGFYATGGGVIRHGGR